MIVQIIKEYGMELQYFQFRTILENLEGIHYPKEYYYRRYGNYVSKVKLMRVE